MASFTAFSSNGIIIPEIIIDNNITHAQTAGFSKNSAGSLPISFIAADVFGQQTRQDITINVIKPNITILAPLEGESFPVGRIIDLTEQHSGIDSSSVEWFMDGNRIMNPDNFYCKEAGSHTITAKVYTSAYNSDWKSEIRSYTDSVTISVINRDPPAVQIVFPESNSILFKDSLYQFIGSYSADTPLVEESWQIGDSNFQKNPTSYLPRIRYTKTSPLTYSYTVMLKDGSNLSSTIEKSVIVKDPIITLKKSSESIISLGIEKKIELDPMGCQDLDEVAWYLDSVLQRTFTITEGTPLHAYSFV